MDVVVARLLLGVEVGFTREELQLNYLKLGEVYHPTGIDGAEFPAMQQINEAFAILKRRF